MCTWVRGKSSFKFKIYHNSISAVRNVLYNLESMRCWQIVLSKQKSGSLRVGQSIYEEHVPLSVAIASETCFSVTFSNAAKMKYIDVWCMEFVFANNTITNNKFDISTESGALVTIYNRQYRCVQIPSIRFQGDKVTLK